MAPLWFVVNVLLVPTPIPVPAAIVMVPFPILWSPVLVPDKLAPDIFPAATKFPLLSSVSVFAEFAIFLQ